jgi:hypothetical protein
MEILVVVTDPDGYRTAVDGWRRIARVTQELPPWLALADIGDQAPDVPGTRWYTGAVPPDVLLRMAPQARLFVAAWLDRRQPKDRPGDGRSWDAPGLVPPDRPPGNDE